MAEQQSPAPRPPGGPRAVGRLVENETGLQYLRRRISRHWYWGRTQGFGRLLEEDQLNPLERVPTAVRKWAWRHRHGIAAGSAVPVYVVGVQRSGTNMLVRGLELAPEFEVHNENDARAFTRFRLRPDAEVAALVAASRHRYVLFKPLCDSHRVDQLLDELPARTPGRAIWIYRGVDGRARSALQKFGDVNLQVLRMIAEGRAGDRWQAQRQPPARIALLRSFDYDAMSPETGAALFWYLRNSLYFDLGLDRRPDVFLTSYDAMTADPEPHMRALCRFLDLEWQPSLTTHMAPRAAGRLAPLPIDPRVRELCDELEERLNARMAGIVRTSPT